MQHFSSDLDFGEGKYKKEIEEFIKEYLKIDELQEVGGTQEGIKKGYDYIAKINGKKIKIERKLRRKYYGDMLIEYQSNTPTDKEGKTETRAGWITKSKAQIFFYLWLDKDKIKGLVFNLPSLRNWYFGNRKRYPTNFSQNPKYKTHFSIVPISDIPDECFLKQPTYKEN